jgi:hypothetical protein
LANTWKLPEEFNPLEIYTQFLEADDHKHSKPVMEKLAQLAEVSFCTHLKSEMGYFAQPGSKTWKAAFGKYSQALKEAVENWVKEEQGLTGKHAQAQTDILAKLNAVLDQDILIGLFPVIGCSIPLLCPSFIVELDNQLELISPAIEMVSSEFFKLSESLKNIQVCGWYVPGIPFNASLRASKGSISDFPSISELLFHHLHYFKDSQSADWAISAPPDYGEYQYDYAIYPLAMRASFLSSIKGLLTMLRLWPRS